MKENLIIIKTNEQFNELRKYLLDKDFVSFDTETDGIGRESRIIGFSVCAEADDESATGYYVILSYWDVPTQTMVELETKQNAREFMLILQTKKLIMHNAVFDCAMVENNFQVSLMPSVHTDTMILGHLLNENRSNGLKELGVALFGADARQEQMEMKESVHKNGGKLTKDQYELYKADADLIGRYGAKDAILTYRLFWLFTEQLYDQGLDKFFYEDESMPLLRGATYDLNTTGLRVDPDKLQRLKNELEAEIIEQRAFINKEIWEYVKDKYPGTKPRNTFNIRAPQQLAWLLFDKIGLEFHTLTDSGKDLCKALDMRPPYSKAAKRAFIAMCKQNHGRVYEEGKWNWKTKKMGRPKRISDPWKYMSAGKKTMKLLAEKYKWVEVYLAYAKNVKLLSTYVVGIQTRMQYNVIRPSFLQHGTTSGRYSSRNPNFQNLPRDDKRVKSCIVARPNKVFVGADYSQLEPRVFASFSGDKRLLECFANGDDFYSVIGVEVFEKHGCSLKKDEKNSFAKLYPKLRDAAKVVALSATYGTTAPKMAPDLGKTTEEAQEIIDNYFHRFPQVRELMLESHAQAKKEGKVENLFGRVRRIPEAQKIPKLFGDADHSEIPYEFRNVLNLSVNHRIQSTGASIMNRAAISCKKTFDELIETDIRWKEAKVVMQVHDELILEVPAELGEQAVLILKDAMENTVTLPGVALIAEPKIATNLADLK